MLIEEYVRRSRGTAIYDGSIRVALEERSIQELQLFMALEYTIGKLNGEAGELSEEINKALRDDYAEISPERKERMAKELGDVLWYVAQISHKLNIPLDVIAFNNLRKLEDRQNRGVLGGSGDER